MLAFYLVRFVIMMDAISRVWVGIGCGFYCVRSPRRFKDKGVSVDGWSHGRCLIFIFLSGLVMGHHVLACSTCAKLHERACIESRTELWFTLVRS